MKLWLSKAGSSGLVDSTAAHINPFDHGLTVGDGVFETLKVSYGQPFALTRHLERLARSAQVLGLPDLHAEDVRAGVHDVVRANPDASMLGRLRITVTSGEGPLASDRAESEATVIVALVPMNPWPATTSATFTRWRRNEYSPIVGAKSTSYAENVVALAWARERGYSEGLFKSTSGYVSEGTGSNIFIVLDGEVLTPPLSTGCLAGITRDLVIEWCGATESEFTQEECLAADEVFLTSSTRDVHPVATLDDREWPAPGPVTLNIARAFNEQARANIDP